MTGRREILVWAAVAAAVVTGFVLWHQQRVEIDGQVAVRSWNGELSVPQPARAAVYPRQRLTTEMGKRLLGLPAKRADAEQAHAEAMRAWRERSVSRDEALRILKVAERANAADLSLCRERYDKAKDVADGAFAELERRAAELEKIADPADLLAGLPGATDATNIAPDGRFELAGSVGRAPVVLVSAGEGGSSHAWLIPVEAHRAGRVAIDCTNENMATMQSLRAAAGLPGN